MGSKSESTGNNNKKAEKMWHHCSDDTGVFPKMNKMEENEIEGAGGMKLARNITIFSTWILIELKPGLDVQKILVGVQKSCRRILESFVLYWKGKNDFASCKVLKDRKYDTWMKDFKSMVEIRGRSLMFIRVQDSKVIKVLFVG